MRKENSYRILMHILEQPELVFLDPTIPNELFRSKFRDFGLDVFIAFFNWTLVKIFIR